MNRSIKESLARTALAFVGSPLVPILLLSIWLMLESGGPGWRRLSMRLWDTIFISYLVVILFGLPLTLVFELFRLKLWWQYALTGLVMGTTLMVVSYQLIPVSDTPIGDGDYYQPVDWGRSLAIGFIAAATALAFWWLRHGKIGLNNEAAEEDF